jgi:hypothetical protein
MSTSPKPSGQPIYQLPKPATVTRKTSLDAQADEIRKSWTQSAPNRSK